MLVLNFGDVKPTQLVQASFGDGLGLCLTEIERIDASDGFITPQHVLELLPARARFPNRHDVVNAVLCLHQPLENVGSGFGFVQVKSSPALDHRLSVRHVGVNHGRQVQQDGAAVKNAHHVRRVRLLEAA